MTCVTRRTGIINKIPQTYTYVFQHYLKEDKFMKDWHEKRNFIKIATMTMRKESRKSVVLV